MRKRNIGYKKDWIKQTETERAICHAENKTGFLDTDIGDDIDDAFALAYALRHPEIELLGVSTVFRNTVCRKN